VYQNRIGYVEDFVKKLHNREYIIDSKANEIKYGDKTLSQALSDALGNWEFSTSTRLVPDSIFSTQPFAIITAAFAHGVVIEKNDVRKQLSETERRLEECEHEKQSLQKDINSLTTKLTRMNEINTALENDLKKYEAKTGDVTELHIQV